jgi:putative ABC transport system substrate-binding protein
VKAAARHLISALALLAALDLAAQAPSPMVPRIGYCYGVGDPGHIWTRTFIEGLRKRGWEDGRNVRVVLMPLGSINNEDFGLTGTCQAYMADQNLDVLVIPGHRDAHPKIPVVTQLPDVAGSELARSKTRNVTGLTSHHDGFEIEAKRIALLKEAVGARRIMLLRARPSDPKVTPGVEPVEALPVELRDVARKLGIELRLVSITKPEDFDPAFKAMSTAPRTAVIFYDAPGWAKVGARPELPLARAKYWRQLPFMWSYPDPVAQPNPIPELAPIIAYGLSKLDEIDRHAYFVDRILRGAKPADLPFEQAPYRLAVNVEAAKQIGITFPPSILTQADWVVPHQHPQFDWTTTPQPPSPPEFEERLRAILRSQ